MYIVSFKSHKLHWKYNSHWAVGALTKLLCTLISHDFWWKGGSVDFICQNWITHKKTYGREELLLYTANKTVEACALWVSALYSHLALYGQYSVSHLTLTITLGQRGVNSLPLTASAPFNISHKSEGTEAWKALRRMLT